MPVGSATSLQLVAVGDGDDLECGHERLAVLKKVPKSSVNSSERIKPFFLVECGHSNAPERICLP
jgi:hypothetical protein